MSTKAKKQTQAIEKPAIGSKYTLLAEIFSALSHPIRLQIIDLLLETPGLNCSEILEVLKIPKPNLSQHLHVLKNAGLVKSQKQGLFQNYNLLNIHFFKSQKYLTNFTTSETDKHSQKNKETLI